MFDGRHGRAPAETPLGTDTVPRAVKGSGQGHSVGGATGLGSGERPAASEDSRQDPRTRVSGRNRRRGAHANTRKARGPRRSETGRALPPHFGVFDPSPTVPSQPTGTKGCVETPTPLSFGRREVPRTVAGARWGRMGDYQRLSKCPLLALTGKRAMCRDRWKVRTGEPSAGRGRCTALGGHSDTLRRGGVRGWNGERGARRCTTPGGGRLLTAGTERGAGRAAPANFTD